MKFDLRVLSPLSIHEAGGSYACNQLALALERATRSTDEIRGTHALQMCVFARNPMDPLSQEDLPDLIFTLQVALLDEDNQAIPIPSLNQEWLHGQFYLDKTGRARLHLKGLDEDCEAENVDLLIPQVVEEILFLLGVHPDV